MKIKIIHDTLSYIKGKRRQLFISPFLSLYVNILIMSLNPFREKYKNTIAIRSTKNVCLEHIKTC